MWPTRGEVKLEGFVDDPSESDFGWFSNDASWPASRRVPGTAYLTRELLSVLHPRLAQIGLKLRSLLDGRVVSLGHGQFGEVFALQETTFPFRSARKVAKITLDKSDARAGVIAMQSQNPALPVTYAVLQVHYLDDAHQPHAVWLILREDLLPIENALGKKAITWFDELGDAWGIGRLGIDKRGRLFFTRIIERTARTQDSRLFTSGDRAIPPPGVTPKEVELILTFFHRLFSLYPQFSTRDLHSGNVRVRSTHQDVSLVLSDAGVSWGDGDVYVPVSANPGAHR